MSRNDVFSWFTLVVLILKITPPIVISGQGTIFLKDFCSAVPIVGPISHLLVFFFEISKNIFEISEKSVHAMQILTIISLAGAAVSWKLSKRLFTARPILKSFFILNVFADTSTDRNIFSDISKVNLKIRKMHFINDANVCRCFSTAANGKKGWKLVQVTSCFCWILKFCFKSSLISVLYLRQHIFRII